MPADDLTDPAPATTFAHLDATTVLSRGIAELGIYPAVDPLDSTSRIMDPNVVGEEHYGIARGVQKILQVKTCSVTDRCLNIIVLASNTFGCLLDALDAKWTTRILKE